MYLFQKNIRSFILIFLLFPFFSSSSSCIWCQKYVVRCYITLFLFFYSFLTFCNSLCSVSNVCRIFISVYRVYRYILLVTRRKSLPLSLSLSLSLCLSVFFSLNTHQWKERCVHPVQTFSWKLQFFKRVFSLKIFIDFSIFKNVFILLNSSFFFFFERGRKTICFKL